MALFKILHGNSSNISLDITPFHEGWCYVTHDGYFYIDLNIGTENSPNNQRIKLNAKEAESLTGYNIAKILNSSDIEIPTSKAVLDAIAASQLVHVGPEAPTDPNIKVWIDTSEEGIFATPTASRISTINLPVSGWIGGASPYSQVVSINTVTPNTKVELNATVSQIIQLQNDDVALTVQNDAGVVTVSAIGGKPSEDMAIQVELKEVTYV